MDRFVDAGAGVSPRGGDERISGGGCRFGAQGLQLLAQGAQLVLSGRDLAVTLGHGGMGIIEDASQLIGLVAGLGQPGIDRHLGWYSG